MIQKIRLWNFQRHRKLTVEFDSRITSIVGKTDQGKSAIVRALALVCLNDWDNCYLRHGKSTTTVELIVSGKIIKRIKSKGKNVYRLNGKEFRRDLSSGRNVPPEITSLLNVSEENFQFQLDQHFWFHESAGQLSKNLNKIVDLSEIDSAMANIAADLKKAKAEVDVSQDRLVLARSRFRKLKWVPSYTADVRELDALETKHSAIRSRIVNLTFLIQNVSRHTRDKENVSNAILDAKELKASLGALRETRQKLSSLSKLLANIRSAKKIVVLEVPDISELAVIRKEADSVAEQRRNLEMLIDEFQELEDERCQVDQDLKMASNQLLKLGKKRCPKCGQLLNQSSSSHQTYTCVQRPLLHGPKKGKHGSTRWKII